LATAALHAEMARSGHDVAHPQQSLKASRHKIQGAVGIAPRGQTLRISWRTTIIAGIAL